MITTTITIRHKYGIHARPAAKIVSLCNAFASDIEIVKEGEEAANGKNILDIMMLAAGCGESLEVRVKGPDESDASARISSLLESDFETDEF